MFRRPRISPPLRGALLGGGLALLLGACVGVPDLAAESAVQPGSPVALAIEQAKAQPAAYPKFSDIPNIPNDLRTAQAWNTMLAGLESESGAFDRYIAANPPLVTDPVTWAGPARAQLDAIDPPPPNQAEISEAFAREQRERATPPPLPR